MAGYSGTPLAKKLGIKDGHVVHVAGAEPAEFRGSLEPLPNAVTFQTRLVPPVDVAVCFVTEQSELMRRWPELAAAAAPVGAVWVAWPKRASKVPTDITEDVLRQRLLPAGWVDVKVCAIDERWSGLRFVLRKENRPPRSG